MTMLTVTIDAHDYDFIHFPDDRELARSTTMPTYATSTSYTINAKKKTKNND